MLLPSSDPHGSEYLHPHYESRAYFSGFTGSAGTLALLRARAALFTDGRYYLQAEQQLRSTGIALLREGEEGTPSLAAYLLEFLQEGDVVGMDARLHNATFYKALHCALFARGILLQQISGLVTRCWPKRPPLPDTPVFTQPLEYAGETVADKLCALRGELQARGANAMLVTALDDIAWLYNLRGNDIPHNPVAFCYTVVQLDAAYLFIKEERLQPLLREQLEEAGVTMLPYDAAYTFAENYTGARIVLDAARVNYALYTSFCARATIVDVPNSVLLRKSIKNDVELQCMRAAHVRDGIAMLRFLRYLKEHVCSANDTPVTELSAAEVLRSLRREAGALYDSFPAIVAYGPHAAVVHYMATHESDTALLPRGLLLIDSGGQYREGTTDSTRTIALGPVSQEEKRAYTLVLQGMLRFSMAQFPVGLRGDQLDVLARQPLWGAGMDYAHGTGHGVGSFLCVHESPVRVHYRARSTPASQQTILQAGMVLSNEPGVYVEGKYGIRIENQLCVRKAAQNAFGKFLCFETLTLVPIDTAAIEKSLLSAQDIAWLNAYHARVYEALCPHLTEAERAFLQTLTRAIV